MTLQERINFARAAKQATPPPVQTPVQESMLVARVCIPDIADRIRPQRLVDVACQTSIIRQLQAFVRNPHRQAFLFHGDTGVGKTSAAVALANELGATDDISGLRVIASGEQSADAVRDCIAGMWLSPFCGTWRVTIVNECDRMSKQAETIWLDALENLPNRAVVIFTTNDLESLSDRFVDRCLSFRFESCAKKMKAEAVEFVRTASNRHGAKVDADSIVESAIKGGKLSLRRVVNALQSACM